MTKNKNLKEVQKSLFNDLSSNDKTKIINSFGDAYRDAINNNSKDLKEICEVAKKNLECSNISDKQYEFGMKALDVYIKAIDNSVSEEERDKRIKETVEYIEKFDQKIEEKNINNREVFEKTVEANKLNKQSNLILLRNLGIAAAVIAGGITLLTPKGKELASKLLDNSIKL